MTALTEKSPRQSRHLSFISEFTGDIRHISGCKNEAADALSRIEIDNINSLKLPCEIFRYDDFEIAQNNDDSVKTYAELHKDTIEIHNNIICDTSNNQLRPIVPAKYTQTIFNLLQNISPQVLKPHVS